VETLTVQRTACYRAMDARQGKVLFWF